MGLFTSQMLCLRSAPENLKDYFRTVALRKVTKDRTITLYGRIYEAPVALIGKRVELLYHEGEPENIEVNYKNESYGMIRPVNHAVNYRVNSDIDECNQIALFRYGIISDFVNRKKILTYGEQEQLLRSKYNCIWRIPLSNRTLISRGIILYWIKRYEESGGKIESLYPRSRSDIGKSRAIDLQTTNNLVNLTKNSNIHTVKTIISEMKRRGLVTPGTLLTYSSVYFFLHKNGLMDYLNMRKGPTQEESYNYDEDRIWMRKLQHGKLRYEELQQTLLSRMNPNDLRILSNCISKKPLKYRNRALTILSYHKGIPLDLISEFYLVPKPTILNHMRRFEKEGLNRLMKQKRGGGKET